ncbi:hypothetical protein [Clostridium paraputrificum]|uniref:hypothetical protein n=1 Tax=Clostridium paraputrificum TaxID=29363 RepID=UPI0015D47B3B|nr:hypothetical protein [Clostridium paraputrificum]
MKRYYELIGERLVCELNFKKGYTPTLEAVKKYVGSDVREIDKEEFNKLAEEYCNE